MTRWLWLLSMAYFASGCVVEAEQPQQVVGYATYYTKASCQREGTSGVLTANGEVFDEVALTAAVPTHQFGDLYRVCRRNMSRGRHVHALQTVHCVVVRHNDYGPGRGARHKGVVIDLTPAAFQQLAPLRTGKVRVTVERL